MFVSGNFPGCAVGAFVNGIDNLPGFRKSIGRNLAVALWYIRWPEAFPAAENELVLKNGSVPLITREPRITGRDDYAQDFLKTFFGRQDFDSVFSRVYKDLTSLTQKPIMIGEFASAEEGASKADWRICSSGSARTAFCQEIRDSYFVDNLL